MALHTNLKLGFPKLVTYTHRMMAKPDAAATLDGIWETHINHYASTRCYTPLPALHVSPTTLFTRNQRPVANHSSLLAC